MRLHLHSLAPGVETPQPVSMAGGVWHSLPLLFLSGAGVTVSRARFVPRLGGLPVGYTDAAFGAHRHAGAIARGV